MIGRRLVAAASLCCATVLLSAATASGVPTKTYVGPDGGAWNVAEHWSPAGVPTAADEVLVDRTVVVKDEDAVVGVLNLPFMPSRVIVRGVVLELDGDTDQSLRGVSVVGGGTLAIDGSVGYTSIELGEAGIPASTGTVSVAGSIKVEQISEKEPGAGLFRIEPTGVVNAEVFSSPEIRARFENDGLMTVGGGLWLYPSAGSPASDGDFVLGNEIGGTPTFIVVPTTGQTLTLSGDSSFTGSGELVLQTGEGTVQVAAGAEFRPRKLAVRGPSTLDLEADGTIEELLTTAASTPPFDRGGRTGTGTLTVTGPGTSSTALRLSEPGTVRFTGPLAVAPSSGSFGSMIRGGARLVTEGATTHSGGDVFLGNAGGSGVWENAGTLTSSGNAQVRDSGGGLLLNLAGGTMTIERQFGDVPIQNAGTIAVNGLFGTAPLGSYGTLRQTGGSIAIGPTGQVDRHTTLAGGTLRGTGTILSLANTGGTVEPGASPGVLAVTQAFTQAAGGTFRTEIDSAPAFDRVTVGGAATLGGTLAIASHPLFTPELDDEFPILSAATRAGQFASVTGASVGIRRYAPEYSATGVSLCVVEGAGGCGVPGPIEPPANVTASNVTQTSFTVNWTPSPDGRVTRYAVTVDGTPRGEAPLTSLVVDGLACGTAYAVEVRALDADGNASPVAAAVLRTAPCPLVPPSALQARERTETSITLEWTASPDERVTRYRVAIDGGVVAETSQTELVVNGLQCGRTYDAAVRGLDAGVGETTPITANVATSPCSLAPPTQLAAGDVTQTTLTLTWTASPDPRVGKYVVFRDGTAIGEVVGTSFAVAGLSCATTYPFAVRARDALGADSASVTLGVTTAACPLPEPPQPPQPPEPPTPPAPDPPQNVTQPQIVQEPNGNYRCNPGVWSGVGSANLQFAQQQLIFDFTWIKTTGEKVEPVAQTPLIKVTAVNLQSRYLCTVQPRVYTGQPIKAESNPAILGGNIKVTLPPPFGNFRIKGIDVFQVVQPSSGAQHWAPGEAPFPPFPGWRDADELRSRAPAALPRPAGRRPTADLVHGRPARCHQADDRDGLCRLGSKDRPMASTGGQALRGSQRTRRRNAPTAARVAWRRDGAVGHEGGTRLEHVGSPVPGSGLVAPRRRPRPPRRHLLPVVPNPRLDPPVRPRSLHEGRLVSAGRHPGSAPSETGRRDTSPQDVERDADEPRNRIRRRATLVPRRGALAPPALRGGDRRRLRVQADAPGLGVPRAQVQEGQELRSALRREPGRPVVLGHAWQQPPHPRRDLEGLRMDEARIRAPAEERRVRSRPDLRCE